MLYLIRHPRTTPDPSRPASTWEVNDTGRAQIRALVTAPFWTHVTAIYTSPQPKTVSVGEAVHRAHGIPHTIIDDLTEARRDAWLDADAFDAAQRAFLAHPAAPPVPEWEAANTARDRFVAAMDRLLAAHPRGESLAVVTHGTVLTLYVAHLRGEAPSREFWRGIGFATVMAVNRTTLRPVTPFIAAPYGGPPK